MKIHITGPGRAGQIRRSGKTTRTKGGGEFISHLQPSLPAGPAAATTMPTAVEGIFALQEVRDATSEASQAKAFAEGLLDQLDDLRHALLTGRVSPEKLRGLQEFVRRKRVHAADPRLAEILNEIELRAAVELAKYRKAL